MSYCHYFYYYLPKVKFNSLRASVLYELDLTPVFYYCQQALDASWGIPSYILALVSDAIEFNYCQQTLAASWSIPAYTQAVVGDAVQFDYCQQTIDSSWEIV